MESVKDSQETSFSKLRDCKFVIREEFDMLQRKTRDERSDGKWDSEASEAEFSSKV